MTHGYKEKTNACSLQLLLFESTDPSLIVALDQYHTFMSGPDAWLIADDHDHDSSVDHELKPTNSARRIKALVEQVTGTITIPSIIACFNVYRQIDILLCQMRRTVWSSSSPYNFRCWKCTNPESLPHWTRSRRCHLHLFAPSLEPSEEIHPEVAVTAQRG